MSKPYQRKDHFYVKAKEQGYRSRAAFKLIEIQEKYSILRKSQRVLDLGCFPGGWLQVASDLVGEQGSVVGIDLKDVEPFPQKKNIHILKGDLLEYDTLLPLILEQIGQQSERAFDTIISDMSPPLSGIKDKDLAGILETFNIAISYAQKALKLNGNILIKIFPSQEIESLLRSEKKNWKSLQKTSLKSTRNSSNELYVIGKGLKI